MKVYLVAFDHYDTWEYEEDYDLTDTKDLTYDIVGIYENIEKAIESIKTHIQNNFYEDYSLKWLANNSEQYELNKYETIAELHRDHCEEHYEDVNYYIMYREVE